ncbi:MAG: PHP domain-containing protein [Candidatus Flexifilum sp.]|jgi:predicted metal-dependent phosphoesterase TrpH
MQPSSTWRVELHAHSEWSKDSIMRVETILRLCDERKIDRIAITDHNTADGALRLAQAAPDRVIVGEEIMTTRGELLGYFMRETVPPGLSPEQTIARLRDQGAVISVSHPFDRLRKGAWQVDDLLPILPLIDAIEVFNARCIFREDNRRAQAFAELHHLVGTVGSDAHSSAEYGRSVLRMTPFANAGQFLVALKTAVPENRYSSVFIHGTSTTAKWLKRAGLKKRLWSGG